GTSIMTVSVPGQNSAGVVRLVSQTAELLFRQVLLMAPNAASSATPPATPTPTPSGSAAATPSGSASPQPSPSASTRAKVPRCGPREGRPAPRAWRAGGVTGAQARASPTPTPSAPATSGPATPAPTRTVTAPNGTSTWQQASGNGALVSPHVKDLFDKVNCAA